MKRESVSGRGRLVVVLKFAPGRFPVFLEGRWKLPALVTREPVSEGVTKRSLVVVLKFASGRLPYLYQ